MILNTCQTLPLPILLIHLLHLNTNQPIADMPPPPHPHLSGPTHTLASTTTCWVIDRPPCRRCLYPPLNPALYSPCQNLCLAQSVGCSKDAVESAPAREQTNPRDCCLPGMPGTRNTLLVLFRHTLLTTANGPLRCSTCLQRTPRARTASSAHK